MNNHIDDEHEDIVIKYKLHCKQEGKSIGFGCEKNKKQKGVAPFSITNFFGTQQPYKSSNPTQIHFIEDLVLFIAKGCEVVSIMECLWLQCLIT
jgi:hypothetical protein